MNNEEIFKDSKNLQETIDNPSPEFQEYLDKNFHSLFLECNCKDFFAYHSLPSWLQEEFGDSCIVQYEEGYYEELNIENSINYNNKQYKYIDSVVLPEVVVYKSDDGKSCYEYRGSSFMHVFKKLPGCIGFGKFEDICRNTVHPSSKYWCERCELLRREHLGSQFEKLEKLFIKNK